MAIDKEMLHKNIQYLLDRNGEFEVDYLFYKEKIDIDLAKKKSKELINFLIEIQKNHLGYESKGISKYEPLICYYNIFMTMLNSYIKENIIKEDWIKEFTYWALDKSENEHYIKLGLILSEKYIDKKDVKKYIDKYSYEGKYVFYLMNVIRTMPKYNAYLMNIIKNSSGVVKVFCVSMLDIVTIEDTIYLLEKGYKDNKYEDLLIYLIFNVVNIRDYLSIKELTDEQIENISYVMRVCLDSNNIEFVNDITYVIHEILPLISSRCNGINSLVFLYRLKEKIWSDYENCDNKSELEFGIRSFLQNEEFIEIYLNSIGDGKVESEDIIALANFYDYTISFDDFIPYLSKNPLDIDIYFYFVDNGEEEDKKKLVDFFMDVVNIKQLIGDVKDIDDEHLDRSYYGDIIFSVLLKISRRLYPKCKKIALKGLFGNINSVRKEAISILNKYKGTLTKKEKKIILNAYEVEPNFRLKQSLYRLIYSTEKNSGKIEYVNVEELRCEVLDNDIYLLSTNVAGSKFRDKECVQKELSTTSVLFLLKEEDNPYDIRAIRLIGEGGFCVGYIPRKDNFILNNLLTGGKKLYALIKEYDIERDYIRIRVYMSDR